MGIYQPPVDKLLTLGRPDTSGAESDFATLGIGPEHVPELIRLVRDKELTQISATDDPPQWYAHIHAWRALGQLRATEAIEPLLDLHAANQGAADWDEWVTEEVPQVLAEIGPAVLPVVLARLKSLHPHGEVSEAYSHTLLELGKLHPETRAEVVGELTRILETAAENEPVANGFAVSYLLDLKATEAWPAIERSFATDNIDEGICGDLDEVKWQLGLGPEPQRYLPARPISRPAHSGSNAKQRFNERQRKKKLEKKNKKKRK